MGSHLVLSTAKMGPENWTVLNIMHHVASNTFLWRLVLHLDLQETPNSTVPNVIYWSFILTVALKTFNCRGLRLRTWTNTICYYWLISQHCISYFQTRTSSHAWVFLTLEWYLKNRRPRPVTRVSDTQICLLTNFSLFHFHPREMSKTDIKGVKIIKEKN